MLPINTLDPAQRKIANALRWLPHLYHMPISLARHTYTNLDRLLGLTKLDIAKVETTSFTLEDDFNLRIRRYDDQPEQSNKPALIYFHGGGCAIGGLDSHDRFCRLMAKQSKVVVLSVDYGLGPERGFPHSIIDAISAYNLIIANAEHWQLNRDLIGVGGDSAGAYLASHIALSYSGLTHEKLTTRALHRPVFYFLMYPMVDLRAQSDSYFQAHNSMLLTPKLMLYFRKHFMANSSVSFSDPLVSPVLFKDRLAEAFSGTPTYIMTLEHDPLKDEGIAFANSISHSPYVTHEHIDDSMHGFIHIAKVSDRANALCHHLADQVKHMTQSNSEPKHHAL